MESFEKVVRTTVSDGLTSQLGQYSFPCLCGVGIPSGKESFESGHAKAILKGTAGCLVRQCPFFGRNWTWSQRGATG